MYENVTCIQFEHRSPPTLASLCVDTLRGLKRDKVHILPLRAAGNGEYIYYAFSYENYMFQQEHPEIQFCSHPVHYFEYMYDVPFCLILDLDAFTIFKSIARMEQRKYNTPEIAIQLEENEIIKLDRTHGLQSTFCFRTFHEYCNALNSEDPFNEDIDILNL